MTINLNKNYTFCLGNFIFKTPVVLEKSLRILGLLNGISPINWQGVAIKTAETDETKQIISRKWRVHGNIYFEENVVGNEFLNEVNVTDISSVLTREHPEIDHVIEETYVRKLQCFNTYLFFYNYNQTFFTCLFRVQNNHCSCLLIL